LPRAGFRGCLRRFPAMIAVARQKLASAAPPARVAFQTIPNERLSELTSHALFDGAFQFLRTQLRCRYPQCAASLGKLLQPGGLAILCVSTRFCLWEMLWFLLRGQREKAFRRISAGNRPHSQERCPIFYPTCGNGATALRHISFVQRSRHRTVRAASYAETWADGHRRAVSFLEQLDRALGAWPVLHSLGDHVLLEFEKGGRMSGTATKKTFDASFLSEVR